MDRLFSSTRILSRDECSVLMQRLHQMAQGGGETGITVTSWWNGELRWARNRISLASDRRDITIQVRRWIGGGFGGAATNQYDDVSLRAMMRSAERAALRQPLYIPGDMAVPFPEVSSPDPKIWSDATFNLALAARSEFARGIAREAEQHGLLSAGYLEMRGGCWASTDAETLKGTEGIVVKPAYDSSAHRNGSFQYASMTQAQCSMTVRHPQGIGSGWAGLSGYDWAAIDSTALAEQALHKCLNSINPVAIEPGRYTVILEPQAVSDLVNLLLEPSPIGSVMERTLAENGEGPFAFEFDATTGRFRSKLGLKVADERITISHDPLDAQLGVMPTPGLEPVIWIERGILKTLNYGRAYAVSQLLRDRGAGYRPSYRMSGGTTSIEEMISGTKRGLLVSRFSNLALLDPNSLLATGVTRDGLWLVEGGKISRAVKNMRIAESPLFMLNQVEQLGPPVPVFRPVQSSQELQITPAIVPPLKVNDFSFIATNDAV